MSKHAERVSLLLVGADEALAKALRASFAHGPVELSERADADSARAFLGERAVAAVVLDLDLPGAPRLCGELARPDGPALVALVDPGDPAAIELAPRGCDVVEKPASPALLARRVESALEQRRLERELEEHRSRLARAQRLARLGGFEIEWPGGELRCSEEACRVFGFDGGHEGLVAADLRALVDAGQRAAWDAWLQGVASGAS
jgi:DNA-binding response OmpR family regulator